MNIGGTNINLNNVYWTSEANDDNTTYYELQFMSFDMYAYQEGGDFSSFPSSYSVVYLSFDASVHLLNFRSALSAKTITICRELWI